MPCAGSPGPERLGGSRCCASHLPRPPSTRTLASSLSRAKPKLALTCPASQRQPQSSQPAPILESAKRGPHRLAGLSKRHAHCRVTALSIWLCGGPMRHRPACRRLSGRLALGSNANCFLNIGSELACRFAAPRQTVPYASCIGEPADLGL